MFKNMYDGPGMNVVFDEEDGDEMLEVNEFLN
jgi:hypothetical protein